MRRTRKWSFVQQEAQRLADIRLSPLEISRRLGVNKSTVTRWIKAGKLGSVRKPASMAAAKLEKEAQDGKKTAAQWAAAVRKEYALDVTDDQMVSMAESALLVIRDPTSAPQLRLQAMGRFQAIVKQLALVSKATDTGKPDAETRPAARRAVNPPVRRSSVDPRSILSAVPRS